MKKLQTKQFTPQNKTIARYKGSTITKNYKP